MGTKIVERIAINPLGESDINDNTGLRRSECCCVDDHWKSKALTDDERRCRVSSMDRFLDKQNLESIRKTMQAQEDIFKHQVQELHRVYSIQKTMMEEMKKQRRHWTNNNHPNDLTSHQHTSSQNNNKNNFVLLDINTERERSESCSGIDLESPAKEISAVDLGRPKRTNGSDLVDEGGLELTLSIGMSSSSSTSRSYNNNNNQRETTTNNNNRDTDSSTTSFRSDNNDKDCSGPSTPMRSSTSTTLDQEKKKPHWLFQGLSINRT